MRPIKNSRSTNHGGRCGRGDHSSNRSNSTDSVDTFPPLVHAIGGSLGSALALWLLYPLERGTDKRRTRRRRRLRYNSLMETSGFSCFFSIGSFCGLLLFILSHIWICLYPSVLMDKTYENTHAHTQI